MIIYRYFLKRCFDVLLSFIVLLILLPFFVIISLIIIIDSKGSPFFIQQRVGLNKKIFFVYKFRTMINDLNKTNEQRITKVGSLLRKYSVDELPQFFNILKGDMSIVGPRPTLKYQVDRYNKTQLVRLNVRPGLTGLAQVNGRNKLTWAKKIEYDIKYVKNYSFIFDLKIILKTIFVVLNAENTKFVNNDSISVE